MESAIKIAIENGWIYLGEHIPYVPEDLKAPGIAQFTIEEGINFLITKEQALLDPLFWQALGKGLGWGEILVNEDNVEFWKPRWKYEWHRFIDHLAEWKDIDSFFTNLIK